MSSQSDFPQHVAVVILNWNGRAHLETYLPSVLEHTLEEAEVWVADNGSTDDSLAWLEVNHPEVRTISLGHNWGFALSWSKMPIPHCASMREQLEAGWTRMVFRSAWDVSSMKWNLSTRGTGKTERCFGRPGQRCLFANRRGSRPVVWMVPCLRTWRKSTCVGGFKT